MGVIPDATITAMRGSFNLGLFLYVGTTAPIRIWWGVGDTIAKIDSVDIAGVTYVGAGMVTEIPDALEVLMNGTSDRVDFSLSGVDPALVANLAIDAPPVLGAPVVFGFAILDELWQPKTSIVELHHGVAEAWLDTTNYPPKIGDNATATITLITTSGTPSRSSASILTWTDPAQKRISSTDRFCERVPGMYQTRIIRWPRF